MKDWGQIDDYNARFRGPIENPLLEGYKATSEIKQRQEQLEQQRAQNQLNTMKYLAEQQKASEIKGNIEAINANPADSAAVRRLAALDPAAAERVLTVNKIQNEQKGNVLQEYQRRKAADKPALYQQIRESVLPSIGVDTSAWPTEYGDVANGIIEQELSKGRSTKDSLEEEYKRAQIKKEISATAYDYARIRHEEEKAKIDKLQSKASPGWRYTETGELEPIPGGAIDLKLQAQYDNDTTTKEILNSNGAETLRTIDQLANSPGLSGILGFKGAFPNFPGGEAADAQALYDTLTSKNFVNQITTLKNLSKTGSTGLGNLSNKEGDKLQNAVAALQRSQNIIQFRANLANLKKVINESNDIFDRAYKRKYKSYLPEEEQQVEQKSSNQELEDPLGVR